MAHFAALEPASLCPRASAERHADCYGNAVADAITHAVAYTLSHSVADARSLTQSYTITHAHTISVTQPVAQSISISVTNPYALNDHWKWRREHNRDRALSGAGPGWSAAPDAGNRALYLLFQAAAQHSWKIENNRSSS